MAPKDAQAGIVQLIWGTADVTETVALGVLAHPYLHHHSPRIYQSFIKYTVHKLHLYNTVVTQIRDVLTVSEVVANNIACLSPTKKSKGKPHSHRVIQNKEVAGETLSVSSGNTHPGQAAREWPLKSKWSRFHWPDVSGTISPNHGVGRGFQHHVLQVPFLFHSNMTAV